MSQSNFGPLIGLAWGLLWFSFFVWRLIERRKERERIYELLQKASDEGKTLPPEVLGRLGGRRGPMGDVRAGLFWLAVGVGLAGAGLINYSQYAVTHPNAQPFHGTFALFPIPLLVGVAYLIVAYLRRGEGANR